MSILSIDLHRALPSSDMSFSTTDDDSFQNYHSVATYNGYNGSEQFSRPPKKSRKMLI
jgi:hypothetical protein